MKKILMLFILLSVCVFSQSEVTQDDIKFWPNPFNSTINIQYDVDEIQNLVVYDILGNEIKSITLDDIGTHRTQLSFDASGVYIVVVGKFTAKIICQK